MKFPTEWKVIKIPWFQTTNQNMISPNLSRKMSPFPSEYQQYIPMISSVSRWSCSLVILMGLNCGYRSKSLDFDVHLKSPGFKSSTTRKRMQSKINSNCSFFSIFDSYQLPNKQNMAQIPSRQKMLCLSKHPYENNRFQSLSPISPSPQQIPPIVPLENGPNSPNDHEKQSSSCPNDLLICTDTDFDIDQNHNILTS